MTGPQMLAFSMPAIVGVLGVIYGYVELRRIRRRKHHRLYRAAE